MDNTKKADYELQEKCSNKASNFFKEYTEEIKEQEAYRSFLSSISYENHYNTKLNKCFIQVYTYSPEEAHHSESWHWSLYDVNEHKEYGDFHQIEGKVVACNFETKSCHSLDDWLTLAKPYMTD